MQTAATNSNINQAKPPPAPGLAPNPQQQSQQQQQSESQVNTIVEEKVVNKETGEVTYRKYLKGRFLGKVILISDNLLI